MGDYKRFIILVAVLVIAHFSIHYYADREEDGEENGVLRYYSSIVSDFHLSSDYYMVDDSPHIELYPTEFTQEILERWKWVSEDFSEINYPAEAIEQNDWLVAYAQLTEGLNDIAEKGYQQESIRSYIFFDTERPEVTNNN
ncbi:hypothetical protein HXA31_18010 [Salipaludibacillus agaradhaerens]|uniref:Uncharacterized protein n=1 Tax=Salipaludibacillus agaradhaerens TaxID=76935 RepID=A0A9Q4B4A0_SALAG|nr:hypothetical protein [Salipaludibacillus agaradhaerens]MCR6098138.1 hypothetical protein [Salipaludibacillus agaradhaerens]MCR6116232.1 hypothetical protein [Salipaludibacillus agaradhaerens]